MLVGLASEFFMGLAECISIVLIYVYVYIYVCTYCVYLCVYLYIFVDLLLYLSGMVSEYL